MGNDTNMLMNMKASRSHEDIKMAEILLYACKKNIRKDKNPETEFENKVSGGSQLK